MFYRLRRGVRKLVERSQERLRRTGEAITSPVERTFAATFGRLFRAAEGAGRIEEWLFGFGKLLLWPFQALWSALAWVAGLLLPRSLRSRFGSLSRRSVRGLVRLAERLNLDGPIRRVVWLTQPIWRPVAAIGGFIYAWLATRPYRQMLWGLPALLLLAPIGAAAAWGLLWGRGAVAANYRLAVKESREAGDYERMELFERKLHQLGVDTQQTAFKTAVALAEDGKLTEAYERMKQLAPATGGGYPSAHFWIVQQLFRGELKESPEDVQRLVGLHLDQLEAARIRAPEIKLMRALWLANEQRLPEAAEALKPLVRRFPAAAIQRMSINLALRNVDEAKRDARAVRTHLEDRRREGGKLSAEEYQSWTVAEGLVGDEPGQADVVEAWHRDFPNDALAKQARAELARRDVDKQLQASRPNAREIAARIIDAAELGGAPSQLHGQIGQLFQQRDRSPVAAAVIDELSKSPDAPALILQLLGTHEVVSGDAAKASKLLKRAVEKNPKDAIAWNNYACSLLELPNSDMHEALDAVNNALAIAPDAPQFRETRGQVLVRLKHWEKAVEDLELAINGMPNSKTIHRSLADAYAALGQQDLASVHREQAQ